VRINRFLKSGIDLFLLKTKISNDYVQKKFIQIDYFDFRFDLTMPKISLSVVHMFTLTFNHTHSHPLRR